jgi:hypothetical protein
MNIQRVSDIMKIEIYTAKPFVSDPGPFETEIAIAKLKRYILPGSGQIPAELIQAVGEILCSKNQKLILFQIRKNCLISGRIYHCTNLQEE